MKSAYAIGIASSFVLLAATAWVGCSDSSSGTTADAGTDSPSTSGSSSGSTADGSGDSSGQSGSSGGTSGADAGALTWTQVYSDVVAPHCAGCHGGLPAADGGVRGGLRVGLLDLSSVDAGWANLIDMPARGTGSPAAPDASFCDSLEAGAVGSVRVVPGNATSSLLALKLNGFVVPPPCGAPMPEPTPGPGEILDGGQAAAFTEVQTWINQGALP